MTHTIPEDMYPGAHIPPSMILVEQRKKKLQEQERQKREEYVATAQTYTQPTRSEILVRPATPPVSQDTHAMIKLLLDASKDMEPMELHTTSIMKRLMPHLPLFEDAKLPVPDYTPRYQPMPSFQAQGQSRPNHTIVRLDQ